MAYCLGRYPRDMSSDLIFIYDGECPFCNHFAELLELRSNLPNIELKNARTHPAELPNGYDMDMKGAILIENGTALYGADAIYRICSKIKNPSSTLLEFLLMTFSSKQRSRLFFPFLLLARRFTLFFKGVPRKLNSDL